MKHFLVIILSFVCLCVAAQKTKDYVRPHLSFCGVSMNNCLEDFTDSLLAKSFVKVDSVKDVSPLLDHVYLQGRFENIACTVDVGQSVTHKVDTLKVYLNDVNNPVLSFKILTNFYRSKCGSPVFDNYYYPPMGTDDLKQQLSIEPYVIAFSVAGGVIQFELKYIPLTHRFVYSVLFVDTENALPVIPQDDAVIEW